MEKDCFGWEKGKVCAKESFWFVKMGIFCGQRRKARAKEVFARKKGFE